MTQELHDAWARVRNELADLRLPASPEIEMADDATLHKMVSDFRGALDRIDRAAFDIFRVLHTAAPTPWPPRSTHTPSIDDLL